MRKGFMILPLVAVVSLLVARTDAQQCSEFNRIYAEFNFTAFCGYFFTFDALPLPNPPPNMACCNPTGAPLGQMCAARRRGCGYAPVPANPGCTQCGSPIDLASGDTFITETDLSIPGLGGGLRLVRTWNSIPAPGQFLFPVAFGTKWRSTYEEFLLFDDGNGYVKYERADGTAWTFSLTSIGTPNVYGVEAPANNSSTLVSGSPNWILTLYNGEKRLFNGTTGQLVALIDRNGNTTQVAYDSSSRILSVTDPVSRHLYFNYSDNTTLVTSVTSDVGISLSYAYDAKGCLQQLTKADGTTISFTYDDYKNITSVTDANGKILESHTYDVVGHGLSSSRANGVDAVKIGYPHLQIIPAEGP